MGTESRTYHYRERMEKLMKLDFELLNTVLGIEINPQMNPAVIQSVIRHRLTELSAEEVRAIPDLVVEIIVAISGDHANHLLSKYLRPGRTRQKAAVAKVAPAKTEQPAPVSAKAVAPEKAAEPAPVFESPRAGVLTITQPGKTPMELSRMLSRARAWTTWVCSHAVRVSVAKDSLVLSAPLFADFSPDQMRDVFRRKFGL